MPLGSDRPSTKTNRKVIVADFNDRSEGEKSKCSAIIDVIVDNDVDVLRLTEPSGDEAKRSDLSPPGYRTHSFPRPSCGGGIAFVVADSLAPCHR